MRNSIRRASVLAILLAALCAVHDASAQGRQNLPRTPGGARPAPAVTPSGGTRIAVVDISRIFKGHDRFKQLMENMKQDVQAFETTLKQRGAQMQKMSAQLQEHRSGSQEYGRIEADITQFQAQVQADTQLKRKDFLQREARIYFDIYSDVTRHITYYAQRTGIDLVLRFNSEAIDPQNRKSVLEGVNRAVVYENRLDITDDILRLANRSASSPQGRPANETATRPRTSGTGTRPTTPPRRR